MSAPLVSLVIRSIGRSELVDALGAVAAQDHPALEAVVVDATGGCHPATPSHAGPHPVRFVRGRSKRSRPEAANAGLDAAEGAIVGLLDDDDLIEPTHVSSVLMTLASMPSAPAAYSSAREVDATGAVVSRRTQGWSRFLLYQDCYLVSNSLLFRRTMSTQCRFDLRFDICEDWDFWLQLSEIGDFVHLPAETAIARVTLGQSGTGHGANRDRACYEHFRALLAQKWSSRGAEIAAELDAAAREAAALLAEGRTDDGRAAAELVLDQYPFHVEALSVCGAALALHGDLAGAVLRFRSAVAENPQYAASRLNLARALERGGRIDEAMVEYRAILAQHPSHSVALARMRDLEAAGNRRPHA